MPESPLRPPRPVCSMEEALAVLREGGGRATAARRAILAVLFDAAEPLPTERIAQRATPALDVPSTYRNLEHLEQIGLVRHVHLGHGPGLYELISGEEREYALCESCGAVTAFPPARLDEIRERIDRAVGYRVRFTHFPLVGVCAACRSV